MTASDPALHPLGDDELDRVEQVIDAWLSEQVADNPVVAAGERDPERGTRRWMVRVEGEEKSSFTVWFDLRQRALHAETYVAPAPLERHEEVWEYVLRRNARLRSVAFSIGVEDAVFLTTELPATWVDEPQLDRMLGSLYEATEHSFRPIMRLGYGDLFKG